MNATATIEAAAAHGVNILTSTVGRNCNGDVIRSFGASVDAADLAAKLGEDFIAAAAAALTTDTYPAAWVAEDIAAAAAKRTRRPNIWRRADAALSLLGAQIGDDAAITFALRFV